MMSNVVKVDFTNVKNAVPAFMTIITMLLAYSITKGIGVGIVSYVVINGIIYLTDLIAYKFGRVKEKPHTDITIVTLIVFVLFMIYFLVPTIL